MVFALGHLVIATAGVAISTALIFFSLKPVLALVISPLSLATNSPLRLNFFPLQSLVAFVIGYFGGSSRSSFRGDKSARYVWVVPLVWFALFFLCWSPRSVLIENRWDHFFWSNTEQSKSEQLVTTLPLLTSLAYAIGSYVSSRRLTRSTPPQANDDAG